jgi:hypothetical protein
MAKYPLRLADENKARSALPPPLEHEGERTQPGWLFNFLKNPEPVRPANWMALRMPRFNMSDEEAIALVNYFAAVDRLENPSTGITAPYLAIPQRDDSFWNARDKEYAARMGKTKLVQWTKDYLANLKEQSSDEALKKSKTVEELLGKLEKVKEDDLKKMASQPNKDEFTALRSGVAGERPYMVDGYRLLVNAKSPCLECHRVGRVPATGNPPQEQGPPLEISFERLRPEWTERWLANPKRLFTNEPNMPGNFPRDKEYFRDVFDGASREQIAALRDVLMNYPKVADLPANRGYPKPTPGGK